MFFIEFDLVFQGKTEVVLFACWIGFHILTLRLLDLTWTNNIDVVLNFNPCLPAFVHPSEPFMPYLWVLLGHDGWYGHIIHLPAIVF